MGSFHKCGLCGVVTQTSEDMVRHADLAHESGAPLTVEQMAKHANLLSAAEVASILVGTIESEADDYQSFEWKPVQAALKAIEARALERAEILVNGPPPVKVIA